MGNQNGGPASAKNQQWNYDAAGNWTSTTKTIGNNTTTENRQHSVSDQLTSIGNNAATHDAKGNLTAYEINGKEYEVDYDLDNRIIKADIDGDDVEYRYDAFGRRVIRKEGSTKTALIWWANSECAEYKHSSGQASIQNDLFSHPSRLNAVIARAVDGSKSKLQWYHKNYLDHVYAVSDDDGDILEHYRYTAFGEVTIYNATGIQQTTTQINNQILWNTRRRDSVSGFYMYKFRHYSAELGRWPSRDPLGDEAFLRLYIKNMIPEESKPYRDEALKMAYAFTSNDPLNQTDMHGLIAPAIPIIAGGATITAAEMMGISVCACLLSPECRALIGRLTQEAAEAAKKAACITGCMTTYELKMIACLAWPKGKRGVCTEQAAEDLADCLLGCD